jgi:predicted transcriptional regulator
MARSRKKFLTSVRLYPGDVVFLKDLALKTDRTLAFYIQQAVSEFVRLEKLKQKDS